MFQALKAKLQQRMGFKLVAAVSAAVLILTIAGAIVAARYVLAMRYEERREQGRVLADFLGRSATDAILFKDLIRIDGLVSDALRSQDALYVYVVEGAGAPLSTVAASFNTTRADVQQAFQREHPDDVSGLAAYLKKELDILEVATDVSIDGSRIGAVMIGYPRSTMKREAVRLVVVLLAASLAFAVVMSAIIFLMIRKMVVHPTMESLAVATRMAAGDLTRSVPVTSRDELGMLGQGLNAMIAGLKTMLGGNRESAGKLEAVSEKVAGASSRIAAGSQEQRAAVEEAASSVNEMHFSLKEIGGNVEDLNRTVEQTSSRVIETSASSDEVARMTQELSAMVESTVTAIAQMSAAIREIAGSVEGLSSIAEGTATTVGEISASVREVDSSARQSAKLAEAVTADARELGMHSIDKAIDGMRLIDEETRRTAEVINRLGGRAESIGSILTVIGDITDKTSLLALNAAILAARAGEQGKGFSVVAVEIRELANRTAASTQEISELIKSVQAESREAVAMMQKGVARAEDGTRLTNDAGAALRKILERAGQSRDMSGIISRATVEQTLAMKQVSEAVERVSGMARQIARATGEQRAGSDQITRAAERMREITNFVKGAATEQVQANKEIVAAVETISAKIGQVHRASDEVRTGSDLIVKAIDRIKLIAKENALQAGQLGDSVQVMTAQTVSLKSDIERFRV